MRFAICNELFTPWPHQQICAFVHSLGYEGLEIAPFTLASSIGEVTQQQRKSLRQIATDNNIQIIGLHWLLAKTEGLHLTSPDAQVRRATALYLKELIRCCHDLGGELLVLGSPKQRQLTPQQTLTEGLQLASDTISHVLPELEAAGVDLCIEPLGPEETNFINTLQQAHDFIQLHNHPRLRLHMDIKAMSTEGVPIEQLIARFGSSTRHFHANDPNRLGPGMGHVDFHPIFAALKQADYKHWISVEVFDFSPGPETIARESLAYMRACLA